MKLKKIGSLGPFDDEEEVPANYEPLCPQLGEHVYYVLDECDVIQCQGFDKVTSYLLHRIEQLEAIVKKLVGDIYEPKSEAT